MILLYGRNYEIFISPHFVQSKECQKLRRLLVVLTDYTEVCLTQQICCPSWLQTVHSCYFVSLLVTDILRVCVKLFRH